MKRRRSNAGLFQRLLEAGSKSTSRRGELKSRRAAARKQSRLEAVRKREAEREELKRERLAIREANRVKREMLKDEQREQRRQDQYLERASRASRAAKRSQAKQQRKMFQSIAGEVRKARERRKETQGLGPGYEQYEFNPARRYIARQDVGGEYLIIDRATNDVIRTAKTKAAAIQIVAHLNAKASPGWELKRNPRGSKGKFKRCVEAVTKRGGARDPQAVCGAMEKRLRKNPDDFYNFAVMRGTTKPRGNYIAHYNRESASKTARDSAQMFRKTHTLWGNDGSGHMTKLETWTPGKADRLMFKERGWNPALNPADAAMAVSEEFHGRPVKAMIPVQQKRHYHKYLAELGELRKLVVETRDGKHRVTLSKFDGAVLTTNEAKNQLFITGGDQSVNLSDFGIRNPHEVETLGEVVKIEYFTDKEHLGSEGGEAVYVHKFRATNDNGKHKTVRMARNPDLIYYLRDEHLEFSGGSYEIRAEGIDK